MRPLDPRLLRHASAARTFVVLTATVAVVTAGLVLVQAELIARGIAGAFLDGADFGSLATRGLDGLEGYLSRYLPTPLVAAVVPAVVAARILAADWLSGLVVALTVALIPIFMILVGSLCSATTSSIWWQVSTCWWRSVGPDASPTGCDRSPRTTGGRRCGRCGSRSSPRSFSSSSPPCRSRSWPCRWGCGWSRAGSTSSQRSSCLLAPEVYLPLRAVGARFHDAAEGLAAATEV